jgi:hypothetical protein
MHFFRIAFLLFLLFPLFTKAQSDTVFKSKLNNEYIIKYSEDSSIQNKNNNAVIEEISKSIQKILDYTQIRFNYTACISATDVSKSNKKGFKKYEIVINVSPENPVGDILYKSFDISGILIPSITSFSIIISENDGSKTKAFSSGQIQIKTGNKFSTSITFTDSLLFSNPEIKLKDIQFHYSDSSLAVFKAKTQYINDYYNSEFILDALQEKYESIDLSYADLTKIYEIKLKEIEKSLAEIAGKNYIDALGLYSNDPIDFINKYSTLNVKVKNLRIQINSALSTIDKVYYDKGKEYFSKNDTANALLYFEKSSVANPYYSPAFLQLARIYFYKGELINSDQNLINITTKLNPDQLTLKQVIQLSDSLMAGFIKKGESYITDENYHEALKYLNEAKTFCTSVKVIICNETLLKDIAKAKYGIYSSFITVSQKAVDNDKLDLANIYIVKAKDYQIENSTDIISSQEADILLGILVTGLTSQGISLNNQMLYDSALVVLNNVSVLCKKYPDISCSNKLVPAITVAKQGIYKSFIKKAEEYIKLNEPAKAEEIITAAKKYQQENSSEITLALATDSLSGKLKEKFYQKYIADGISYLKLHQGINALHCFKTAKEIEKNFLVMRDKSLDSLIDASAKPYVSDYIEKGLVNVWGNEPDKAKAVSDTVRLLMEKFKITQDSTLNSALASLDSEITVLYCKHAEDKYNEYYRTAYQKISLQKYTDACSYFQKCLAVVSSNSTCAINNSTALSGIAKYQTAAKYQKILNQSDSAALAGSYSLAIDKYYEAENFSATINLAEYGLSHMAFSKYITLQDKNYILKTSEYFYRKKNFSETFICLDILRFHNYSDSTITEFQNEMASELCKVDYSSDPEQKSSAAISKYPVSDSWYQPFRKTYLACWKELKKKK